MTQPILALGFCGVVPSKGDESFPIDPRTTVRQIRATNDNQMRMRHSLRCLRIDRVTLKWNH